jgi:tripartite-type tricarboxylate transporter receptor subunit TctC
MKVAELVVAASVAAIGLSAAAVHAQPYPSKPIRAVVPFAPGGSTDIVARAFGQKLAEALGQSVVIDNRGGAGGNIGAALIAKAAPDGYSLLFTTSYLMVNPFVFKDVPYDPVKDFAPISILAFAPMALFVNPQVPAHTVKEMVALAKAQPGKLNYSSSGSGGPPHLAGELFKLNAGVDIQHIPYNGAAPALTEMISGRIQMTFTTLLSAQGFVKAGRIRGIAVASSKRSAAAPDLPTFAEEGLPGVEIGTMFAALAPAKTPQPVIARLHGEIDKMLKTPYMRDLILGQGAEIIGNTPAEFAQYIKDDVAKWARLTRAAGIRPE